MNANRRQATQKSFEAILQDLAHPKAAVRRRAIKALAVTADTNVVSELEAALTNSDTKMRLGALQVLQLRQCWEGVPDAIALLNDSTEAVREAAAKYLSESGDARALPALVAGIDQTGYEGAAALFAFDEPGREAALAILKRGTGPNLGNVLYSIRNNATDDPRFVPPLIVLLQSDDPDIREKAAEVLGEFRDGRAVDPLIEALHDTAHGVRIAAVGALGNSGDVRAIAPLITALEDTKWPVRYQAIPALAAFGAECAVEPLLQMLMRPGLFSFERDLVASTLGMLGDARAIEPLLAITNDPEDEIADDVGRELGLLGDRRAVPALLRILRSSYRYRRNEAAEALSMMKETSAVEPICKALDDDQIDAEALAIALGRLRDRKAIPSLRNAVDQDGSLAKVSLQALAELGAIEVLVECLQHNSAAVRSQVAELLGQFGEQCGENEVVVKVLKAASSDSESRVRSAAKKALRRFK